MNEKEPLNIGIWDFRRWDECDGVVYVLKAGDTGFVKVGFTKGNPWDRLASLQTGCPHPLSLVAYWAGTREQEAAIHRVCDSCRVQGEWFDPHLGMDEWLGDVEAVFAVLAERRAQEDCD